MTLRQVLEKEKDFCRFGRGKWDSISVRDIDDETIQVVKLEDATKLDDKLLDSEFLSIGSSTITPTRLRIRIAYDI